jgi:hypothetical protein
MKNVFRVLAICLVFGGVFALSGFTADDNNAAVVIKDTGCTVLNGDGGAEFVEGRITVMNNGGVTNFICKGKGVPNSTGQAVKFNFENTGFLCNTSGGVTDDWQNVVSASGNVTLHCKVH